VPALLDKTANFSSPNLPKYFFYSEICFYVIDAYSYDKTLILASSLASATNAYSPAAPEDGY